VTSRWPDRQIADATVEGLQTLLDRSDGGGRGWGRAGSEIAVLTSGVAAPDGTPIDPDDGFPIQEQ
jgi:hypothetical protein